MCDQTEISYLPGDVVWVKLGPVWWPASVCNKEDVPPEIIKSLRKTPIAIVKFFQEDEYEYVQKLENIYNYNCFKKNDFIKKGLDMLRSKNRNAPSNMKLFPQDIVRAEILTGGNPSILNNDIFQPEEKPSYAELFSSSKKPLKNNAKTSLLRKRPSQPTAAETAASVVPMRAITHPRFLKLSSGEDGGGGTDYRAQERKQEAAAAVRADRERKNDCVSTTYRCQFCDFTTIRLNVIVLHNKTHSGAGGGPTIINAPSTKKTTTVTKRQSLNPRVVLSPVLCNKSAAAAAKKREKKMVDLSAIASDEPKVKKLKSDSLAPLPVIPSTPAAKKRGRPKKSDAVVTRRKVGEREKSLLQDDGKNVGNGEKKDKVKYAAAVAAGRQSYKKDQFKESLLEDWTDFENEENEVNKAASASAAASRGIEDIRIEGMCGGGGSSGSGSSGDAKKVKEKQEKTESLSEKKESCFDFDELEEQQAVVKKGTTEFRKRRMARVAVGGRKTKAQFRKTVVEEEEEEEEVKEKEDEDEKEKVEKMDVDVAEVPNEETVSWDEKEKESNANVDQQQQRLLMEDTSVNTKITKLVGEAKVIEKSKSFGKFITLSPIKKSTTIAAAAKPKPEESKTAVKVVVPNSSSSSSSSSSAAKKSMVIGVIRKEVAITTKPPPRLTEIDVTQPKSTLRIIPAGTSKKAADVMKFTTIPRLEKATPSQRQQQQSKEAEKVNVLKSTNVSSAQQQQPIKVITSSSPNKTQLVQNILSLVQSGNSKITKVMVKSPGRTIQGLQSAGSGTAAASAAATLQKSPGKSIVLTVDALQSLLKSGSGKITTVLAAQGRNTSGGLLQKPTAIKIPVDAKETSVAAVSSRSAEKSEKRNVVVLSSSGSNNESSSTSYDKNV